MKAEWIRRGGRQKLLLFFNGWGMDRRVADFMGGSGCGLDDYDMLVLFDYRDTQLPGGVSAEIARYGEVDLVAWSLGVRAAVLCGIEGIHRAVAINGTLFPVDELRGIPPEIFRMTMEQWSDDNRSRFERRMCIGGERDSRYEAIRSARSSQEQQAELRAILEAAVEGTSEPSAAWRFEKAVIGGRDLIFMPANQRRAWLGTAMLEIADMPHFPFFHLDCWEAVFA